MRDTMGNAWADRDFVAVAAEATPATLLDESPQGVDRTLIRAMLQLSPSERLAMLQGFADLIQAARGGSEHP